MLKTRNLLTTVGKIEMKKIIGAAFYIYAPIEFKC